MFTNDTNFFVDEKKSGSIKSSCFIGKVCGERLLQKLKKYKMNEKNYYFSGIWSLNNSYLTDNLKKLNFKVKEFAILKIKKYIIKTLIYNLMI